MHDDELVVDVVVVRELIRVQLPQWAHLPVGALQTAATVNAIFRVGDELTARFLLRAAAPAAVREELLREATAAQEFAAVSPVPSPRPVALGAPGPGYPLPWSVQSWLPGTDGVSEDPGGSHAFAEDLGRLLLRLRRADTRGRRFSGAGRGGHLADHEEWMTLCFARSQGLVDVPRLRALWDRLRDLPEVDRDVMCHGDLTPPNVLVGSGRLVGVLDVGGFAPADPALDLVSAWHLLDTGPRETLRRAVECGEVQWQRGMAWALQQAMGLVWYYATTNPTMSGWGQRTLDRLLEADRQAGQVSSATRPLR